jgi:hypothetical protein
MAVSEISISAARASGGARHQVIDAQPAGSQAFADRYLLARFSTGGVLVDLVTGNYFRLNRSAALVCDFLRGANDAKEAEDSVSRELKISPEEAAHTIDSVVATLSTPTFHGEIQGPYHFHPSEGGYRLWHGDRCVLEVNAGRIRLASGAESASETQVELYTRALAPKLLFQKQITVLHASACLISGKLMAFAGLSGAGKTTTARAFRGAGARLVSEDLTLLVQERGFPELVVEGEGFVHSWAKRAATQLLSEPQKSLPSDLLLGATGGSTVRLDRILVLDRNKRKGTEFATSPLSEPDALISLMTHGFLGAVEPEAWRRFFASAITLLETVDVRDVSAPDGIERLVPAATRYISSTAS